MTAVLQKPQNGTICDIVTFEQATSLVPESVRAVAEIQMSLGDLGIRSGDPMRVEGRTMGRNGYPISLYTRKMNGPSVKKNAMRRIIVREEGKDNDGRFVNIFDWILDMTTDRASLQNRRYGLTASGLYMELPEDSPPIPKHEVAADGTLEIYHSGAYERRLFDGLTQATSAISRLFLDKTRYLPRGKAQLVTPKPI